MKIWERARIGAMVGASGALVAALISALSGGVRGLIWQDIPFIVFAFVGATAAGLALAVLFGARGWAGWGLAMLGALLSTGAGAALGAVLLLGMENPLHGLSLGLFYVGSWLLSSPPVALGWVGSMALIHAAARRIRQSRAAPTKAEWRIS